MHIFYCFGALFLFLTILYIRILRAITYRGGVPRVGPPGVFGYITTALRYTFNAEPVIVEGRADFSGKPFVIPTLAGPVFLLPPEYLEVIRSSNDDDFNEPTAVNEDLQLPFTMDVHQMETPYQANILRTSVNRAIPSMIPKFLEESEIAISESLRHTDTGPAILPVFHTMTFLVARVSNRVIFGVELCRNEGFLHAIVRFSETVTLIAPFIRWSPVVMQSAVYYILSSILGGKREPLKYIVPFLEGRAAEGRLQKPDDPLVSDLLFRSALQNEPVQGVAIRLLNINFGSIHTSSIFITQALFELALLPPHDLQCIRDEVCSSLESEGGWNKGALLKFTKIDSVLREVGRYYGLMHFALPRVCVHGHDLLDGTQVPPGHRVAIDMKAVHYNPDIYPNPNRCDLFRFSKLREADDTANGRYGFAQPDKNYLPFGAGRHACAGRFFAATELKIMLAHILLHYDISFPPGISTRPANTTFNGAIIPDMRAELVFTPRSISAAYLYGT